eukprot:TRINITY_DN51052_c0_g2_i1.p1 TRINITY_DN51052_c0_g2~~TRINITY_DN51052_c0_g2_i1.p1  ORF type:complete len:662 (+),score=130.60 TRINITY_DN51052_c0_g2_i1:58-2043(+)
MRPYRLSPRLGSCLQRGDLIVQDVDEGTPTPGPQSYNAICAERSAARRRQPSARLSSQDRHTDWWRAECAKGVETPGVGNYNVAAAHSATLPGPPGCARLGTTAKYASPRGESPGPWSYDTSGHNQQLRKRSASALLGGSAPDSEAFDPRLAGSLGLPLCSASHKAFELVSSPSRCREQSPGPGSYQTQQSVEQLKKTLPRAATVRSPRSLDWWRKDCAKDQPTPGVGEYEIQTSWQRAVAKASPRPSRQTSAARRGVVLARGDIAAQDLEEALAVPGPETYNASSSASGHLVKRSASAVMGTAPQRPTEAERSPGPTAYSTENKGVALRRVSPRAAAGKAERKLDWWRTDCAKDVPTPGVGQYDVRGAWQASSGSVAAAKMGSAERPCNQQPKETPGPHSYDSLQGVQLQLRRSLSARFGRASREQLHDRTPGPGEYEVAKQAPRSGSMSRSARTLDWWRKDCAKDVATPGVGTYETQTWWRSSSRSRESPGSTIGVPRSARGMGHDSPGPMAYNTAGYVKQLRKKSGSASLGTHALELADAVDRPLTPRLRPPEVCQPPATLAGPARAREEALRKLSEHGYENIAVDAKIAFHEKQPVAVAFPAERPLSEMAALQDKENEIIVASKVVQSSETAPMPSLAKPKSTQQSLMAPRGGRWRR